MEPLHQPHLARHPGIILQGGLRRTVRADKPHVEVTVIAGPFRLAVAGGGAPFHGQVEERIPEDARHAAEQQLGGAAQAEHLHLLRPEGADADFGHPDGLVRHRLDLGDLGRPFVDRPQVPVEREAVHRDDIHRVQRAVPFHAAHPGRIDGRHAAQHAGDRRIDRVDRIAGTRDRIGEDRPVGIEFRVPMRLVVRLVPDHRGFDHRVSSPLFG